jgi:regulator of replication initiation timing
MKTYEQMLETVFNSQIENIKNDIIKYNSKVNNFIVHSEKTKDYNIFLVYGTGHGSVFSHIYRMVIIENEYENASPIFKEGNAICNESYTIETVKDWAKKRLNNALKQF